MAGCGISVKVAGCCFIALEALNQQKIEILNNRTKNSF